MDTRSLKSLSIAAIPALFLVASVVFLGCRKSEPTTNQSSTMNMNMDHSMAGHEAAMTETAVQDGSATGQTLCPVTGSPIDKNVFIEYQGKKVYFCCADCIKSFKEDPQKYVAKLPQFQN